MQYAMTGIDGFSGVEGCLGHSEPADPGEAHFSVQCALCEPFLAKDPLWAGVPMDVPLTEREQKAADAAKETFNAVAAQSVAALAAALAGGGLSMAQVAAAAGPATSAAALPGVPVPAVAKKAARPRRAPAAAGPAPSS